MSAKRKASLHAYNLDFCALTISHGPSSFTFHRAFFPVEQWKKADRMRKPLSEIKEKYVLLQKLEEFPTDFCKRQQQQQLLLLQWSTLQCTTVDAKCRRSGGKNAFARILRPWTKAWQNEQKRKVLHFFLALCPFKQDLLSLHKCFCTKVVAF